MDQTIPAAVASAAREFGAVTAVAGPGAPRLTYAELHERVAAVAGTLIAEGIEPGDRVALWSPNTHHWVLAALGALYAGATLVGPGRWLSWMRSVMLVTRSDRSWSRRAAGRPCMIHGSARGPGKAG